MESFCETFNDSLSPSLCHLLKKIPHSSLPAKWNGGDYVDYLFPDDLSHETQWGIDDRERQVLSMRLVTEQIDLPLSGNITVETKKQVFPFVLSLFQRTRKSPLWVVGQNYQTPYVFPTVVSEWRPKHWGHLHDLLDQKEVTTYDETYDTKLECWIPKRMYTHKVQQLSSGLSTGSRSESSMIPPSVLSVSMSGS